MKEETPNIDAYIKTFPPDMQKILQTIRQIIWDAAPGATEDIAYRMPTFKLHGNLVHFAAFRHHIGFYPTSSGIAHFQKELSPYRTSKSAVQFPLTEAVPYELIRKIVAFRVAEVTRKKP